MTEPSSGPRAEWPLYEVFVRGKRGLNHVHVARRNEGVSIWVVRSSAITASSPDEKSPLFDPNADKVYRHPTFYDIPADVPHI